MREEDHVRFTSCSISEENSISFILAENLDFDTILSLMKKRKYRLESVPYKEVFLPPEESVDGGSDIDKLTPDVL